MTLALVTAARLSDCKHRSRRHNGTRPQRSKHRVQAVAASDTVVGPAIGDKIPDVALSYFDKDGDMKQITAHELCQGKKAVIFGVPGAFLPTCSMKHLPGYMERATEMRSRGVDVIACVSVNDAFVMDAWAKSLGVGSNILMLADGSAAFTRALGTQLDLTDRGAGVRSRRYAMVVDDCKIVKMNLEEGGAFTISSADDVMPCL